MPTLPDDLATELADDIRHLFAEIDPVGSASDGSMNRFGLTSDERQAMELVRGWLAVAGVHCRYDAASNLRGEWNPLGSDQARLVTGSHVDSVRQGGRFDGTAGVVCAAAAVRALARLGVAPARPVEVVVFTSEEGSRFPIGLLGSTAAVHGLTSKQLSLCAEDGTTVAQALRAFGSDPAAARRPTMSPKQVHAFLEVHIEQGVALEDAGVPVGVVTAIAGPLFVEVEIQGRADHAGATPMRMRRDALGGAAEFILAVEQRVGAESTAVGTVGQLQVSPGGRNVVPGRVVLALDLRDSDLPARDRLAIALQRDLRELAARRQLDAQWREVQRLDPVPIDGDSVDTLARIATRLGFPHLHLPSGAGHDSMRMAEMAPTGMLFVRSRDGLSHTPEEFSATADLATAAHILAEVLTVEYPAERRRTS